MSRGERWNDMNAGQRRRWWLGFATAYVLAAVVLIVLGVRVPAVICVVVGACLVVAALRDGRVKGKAPG